MANVYWFGIEDFGASADDLLRNIDKASRYVAEAGALMLISAAQRNFQGSHAPGEPHVGGNFPNIVTGNLRRSISADSTERLRLADYSVTVAPRMDYGRRVEYGYNGSRGYPYFTPAVQTVIPDFEKLVYKTFEKVLDGKRV
jgi:hypothetical protein